MKHLVIACGKQPRFGNLIPEFERVVTEAMPQWFVMEEVPEAPLPSAERYKLHSFILNPRWLGEIQHRDRRFTFGARSDIRLEIEGIVIFEATAWHHAVQGDPRPVPVKLCKNGKPKRTTVLASDTYTPGQRINNDGRHPSLADNCELQGLPRDFFGEFSPFKKSAQFEMVGNGVPLPMGRAVAKAVKRAMEARCQKP